MSEKPITPTRTKLKGNSIRKFNLKEFCFINIIIHVANGNTINALVDDRRPQKNIRKLDTKAKIKIILVTNEREINSILNAIDKYFAGS